MRLEVQYVLRVLAQHVNTVLYVMQHRTSEKPRKMHTVFQNIRRRADRELLLSDLDHGPCFLAGQQEVRSGLLCNREIRTCFACVRPRPLASQEIIRTRDDVRPNKNYARFNSSNTARAENGEISQRMPIA